MKINPLYLLICIINADVGYNTIAELLPLESPSLEDQSLKGETIHIYISDEIVFGAWNYEYCHFTSHYVEGSRNSEHITFGNLLNALNAVL